jgi:LPS sulfotransferase NodH
MVKLNARRICEANSNWDTFFRRTGLTNRVVYYEDVAEGAGRLVNELMTYFGLPHQEGRLAPATRKQANDISVEWRARILQEFGVGFFEEIAKEPWDRTLRKFDANTLDQFKD